MELRVQMKIGLGLLLWMSILISHDPYDAEILRFRRMPIEGD